MYVIRHQSLFVAALVLAACGLSACGLSACGGTKDKQGPLPTAPTKSAASVAQTPASVKPATPVLPPPNDPRADLADQVIYGLRHNLTDHGIVRANLTGETAFVYEDATRLIVKRVVVSFIDSVGVKVGTLTSTEGVVRVQQQTFEAIGDVVVVSADGRRLTTARLIFDVDRNLLVGTAPYEITGGTPPLKTTGTSFELEPRLIKRPPAKALSAKALSAKAVVAKAAAANAAPAKPAVKPRAPVP